MPFKSVRFQQRQCHADRAMPLQTKTVNMKPDNLMPEDKYIHNQLSQLYEARQPDANAHLD